MIVIYISYNLYTRVTKAKTAAFVLHSKERPTVENETISLLAGQDRLGKRTVWPNCGKVAFYIFVLLPSIKANKKKSG